MLMTPDGPKLSYTPNRAVHAVIARVLVTVNPDGTVKDDLIVSFPPIWGAV
jgi:hypothetical protein